MSSAPSRRLLAGLTTATLLLGGLALAGSASAEGPCPTYIDPAGDATYPQNQPTPVGESPTDNDPDLDILAVSHSVDNGAFTTVVKVTALKDFGPRFTYFDRFITSFTIAKKVVSIRVERDFTGTIAPGGKAVPSGQLRVDGVLSPAKVGLVFDLKASTITSSIAVADLEKAAGQSLDGLPFSAMTTTAAQPITPAVYPPANPAASSAQLNLPADTATAPASASYVFGGSCSGGAPAPAPGPTTPAPGPTGGSTPPPPPPPADGPPALFALPRAGCVLYKDAAGDAFPGKSGVKSPNSDGDLDFTAVAVRSAPDELSVFAKMTALAKSADTPFDGHKFTTSFAINGKTITAVAKAAGAAVTTPATAKATAVFNTAKSYVIFSFPKADLEVAAGAPITAGTAITDLKWVSNAVSSAAGDFDGDTAAGTKPEEKSYAYGDNTCFQPPAAIVTIDTTGRGVYSDVSVVDVSVTDADENPLPAASIHLAMKGMPEMTLAADDDGIAEFSFPVTAPAGSTTLTATFLGNADASAAGAGAPFAISAESTVLKAVGGKGSVTATLKDNDKTAMAGQLVAFKVGSKVTKVKTNAKGVAVLSRLATGSTVTVSFTGLTGKYLAAKAVTTKVL